MRLLILVLGVGMTVVDAQVRKGGNGRPVSPINGVDREDLGAFAGEFSAWKKARLEAGELKDVLGRREAKMVSQGYAKIVGKFEEGRMSQEDFAKLGKTFLEMTKRIGDEPEGAKDALMELRELAEGVTPLVVEAETMTPRVNEREARGQELMWFGLDKGKLSAGKVATLERKMAAIESAKEKAQADEVVSEREREKLLEDARELVAEVVQALAR